MGLYPDVVAISLDGAARAHVETKIATFLARAAVRTNVGAVLEETRLLEFADQRGHLVGGERLLERIVARCKIALGQLRQIDERLARQVEHEVERFFSRPVASRKIDRSYGAASLDAGAVRLALGEVDLVAEIDRVLGARADAGVATRAHLEVDGIVLGPLDLERAEPSRKLGDLA